MLLLREWVSYVVESTSCGHRHHILRTVCVVHCPKYSPLKDHYSDISVWYRWLVKEGRLNPDLSVFGWIEEACGVGNQSEQDKWASTKGKKKPTYADVVSRNQSQPSTSTKG